MVLSSFPSRTRARGVICETRVRGQLRNGGLYENDYGYVFDFLNGRVAQVREYFDSLIAAEAFAGLLW